MDEIYVYLITGFMDSGKTSLIHETLFDQEFAADQKTLIIACEDGDIEYDEERLKKIHAVLEWIERKEDFTAEKLRELQEKHHPENVFIEYNGTWEISLILETELPKGWQIVQSLATVDAGTYEMYYNNMRQMMKEQIFKADVVIFNRCTDETNKTMFRRTVKAINRAAQLVYERADGTIDQGGDEELPFDISGDYLDISDADYAIWYLDAMEHPEHYKGKKIHFLALVYNPEKQRGKAVMVPGRFAMTCCEADIQFIGFKCKYKDADRIPHKSWINLTAEFRVEFAKEYKGKGPVLYPTEITPAERPEDELVYFS